MSYERRLLSELQEFLQGHPVAARWVEFDAGGRSLAERRQFERTYGQRLKWEVLDELMGQGVILSEVKTSSSHSYLNGRITLVVIGSNQSIGADLEFSQRLTHSKLLNRILTPGEKSWGLSSLEAWVVKEASFKSNPKNQGTVLSQYLVTFWDGQRGQGEMALPFNGVKGVKGGSLKSSFRRVVLGPWLMGVAVTKA